MITDYLPATKKSFTAEISPGRHHAMTHGDAFAVLCQHAISHLPDSISERQAILAALMLRAPRDCPLVQHVREVQWHLQAHLRLSKIAATGGFELNPTTDRDL